jgi:hypothetical protein
MKRRDSHIFEKEEHGHYVEPEWVSRWLFEVEEFSSYVYDPACGWGRILHAAEALDYKVWGSDVVDRGRHELKRKFRIRDYLSNREPFDGSVVCNPPFDYVQEFCEYALM